MVDAGYDLGDFGINKNGVDGYWGEKTQSAYDLYLKNGKKPFNYNSGTIDTLVVTPEDKADWHWKNSAKRDSNNLLMWGSGWRDRLVGDSYYNYNNNRYRIVVNKSNGQSYLVDFTNGKYI
jgi:hypothetical protein